MDIPGAYAASRNDQASPHDDDTRQSSIAAAAVRPLPDGQTSPSAFEQWPSKDIRSLPPRLHHDDPSEIDHPGPRLRSSRLWRARGAETLNDKRERKKPLTLLDLPVDVLKEVVREVTHTNDLTSLALCHSALHRLAIPHIYSRFDIVWPDTNTHSEPRSGVDALTYGLATLVMAEEIFWQAPHQQPSHANRFTPSGSGRATDMVVRKRRGNHYAQFTKKFSLGNGPQDWVQEYLIAKEGGKMLGTLVALALARMRSLEIFVWDMPTGVLRDVWQSLSSLADRGDGQECRLQKVWIRWHQNAESILPTGASVRGPTARGQVRLEDMDHVEHPSFSILPALRSLSVLDIDELAYLDEMAVLLDRSVNRLCELRVSIARHAEHREWTTVYDGDEYQQIDRGSPTLSSLIVGEKRLGGVLGVLTGLVHDFSRRKLSSTQRVRDPVMPKSDARVTTRALPEPPEFSATPEQETVIDMPLAFDSSMEVAAPPAEGLTKSGDDVPTTETMADATAELPRQFQLDTLELERAPLSIAVLKQAFDWTRITCLTLLRCANHEALWKELRQTFAPTPKRLLHRAAHSTDTELVYALNLKRVHTNTVSSSLVSFLKETLAPNSLEVLFLQEVREHPSSVTIDSIFKGPIRRHKASLKKLLIDSSDRSTDGMVTTSSRWRRWTINRELLTFICSGKLPKLRELGMVLEYRDWHFFLQHLPAIAHVRSIYLPLLAGAEIDSKELALQIVDIVALRPEIELCYMGIHNKCFEILENQEGTEARPESGLDQHDFDDHDETDDADDDTHEDEEDDEDDDADESGSDASADDTVSDVVETDGNARLRLREILFYDDKVAIFRARHGRL